MPLFVETFPLQPFLGVFAAFTGAPAQEEGSGSDGYWDVGSETAALGEKCDIFAGLLPCPVTFWPFCAQTPAVFAAICIVSGKCVLW